MNQVLAANGETKITTRIQTHISQELIDEIMKALRSVKGWGSIEIYVQNHSVTQITVRNIKKTKHVLQE